MSGKQEKRKRKAAGVDLKADRGKAIEHREQLERERRAYAREAKDRGMRMQSVAAVAAILTVPR